MRGVVLEHEYVLSERLRITLCVYETGEVEVSWEPEMPPKGTITDEELAAYRASRNQFFEEVSAKIGIQMLIVET